MSFLINPYLAKDLSLKFYGAPHDMDWPIQCDICRSSGEYNEPSIMLLCPAMKKFCANQSICKLIIEQCPSTPSFIHNMPKDCKSWNLTISYYNDDIPDIIPLFHNVGEYGSVLETIVSGLEKNMIEKSKLEIEMQKNEQQRNTLINIRDHILHGVKLKN